MEFLKVENLYKVYGKGENQVTALNGVSLTIEKGGFTAIIGSSGSGKSTLLHAIAGVDVPTSGKIYLNGQDVYDQSSEKLAIFRRRQVGLIYQFHNLIPTLNVVENITLPVLMDKRKVNKKRLNDLLHLLGLEDRQTHLPNQLSGGQQQRVAIGRALMNAPQVMLADEPTGSLDSRNGHEIVKLLKRSSREYGQTLILVTHDKNIALQADRIIRISDGMILQDERQKAPAPHMAEREAAENGRQVEQG
ncbi:MAG: ABC transporter ATP-binding protein [Dorea sp.]|jgi:putative ABC transport system ATP-binding protein|nr:ABC transporter ATP-binding protein [Dorea sp.]MCI9603894.1 ABC transporter ATP-binding protein [Ruminococcus sp.]